MKPVRDEVSVSVFGLAFTSQNNSPAGLLLMDDRTRIRNASLIGWNRVRRVHRSGRADGCSVAGQRGEEWSHFQRHLAAPR